MTRANLAWPRSHKFHCCLTAKCHTDNGSGIQFFVPPFKDSAAIQAEYADTVIHVVLAGVSEMQSPRPTGLAMPSFDRTLSGQQVADVMNYIRNAWGNHAPPVSTDTVSAVSKSLKQPIVN